MSASDTPRGDSSTTEPADLSSANPYSLHRAVHARRSEFVRRHRLRVKVGTWNVAACPGTDKDLASWFVDAEENNAPPAQPGSPGKGEGSSPIQPVGGIGLYVLGLQEVTQLAAPAQYMTWIYAADNTVKEKWRAAMEAALPPGFELVVADQMAGLLLLVYAAAEIMPTISNVDVSCIGTGALGYIGNKGAVSARIVLGEVTSLVFVDCHLSSGSDQYYLDRRVWEVQHISNTTRFKALTFSGVSEDEEGNIDDADFAFWFGDLNSRLDSLPGQDIRRLLMLHARGEYDVNKKGLRREDSLEGEAVVVGLSDDSDQVLMTDRESSHDQHADDDSLSFLDAEEYVPDPHEDPASLQATIDSLLPHDQLQRMIRQQKVFHDGWHEGPITFLPSYKYDVGTVGLFDSSEKQRAPSWCDRILYRTRKDKQQYDQKIKEKEEARKKDEEMRARGMEHAGDDDEVLFDYDPENDGDDQPSSAGLGYDAYDDGDDDTGTTGSQVDSHERIHQDVYTSRQRVTSSDHKPVVSLFTIDYDAVVPELKARVHADVARELDRAENEGRPGITIVVDMRDVSSPPRRRGQESSGHIVEVENVEFLKKEVASLTLANTGRVPATFSFVEKPTTEEADEAVLPQWLTTCFSRSEPGGDEGSLELGKEVTLEPGETIRALLQILVDDVSLARMLNEGQATLEEVLVLRVTDGRDHFIPVRATWSPSCIGRSIDELIRVPEGGIRAFARSLSKAKGRLGAIPYDLDVHNAAPKELFRLTEAMETLTDRVLADEQMLDDCSVPPNPGWPFNETSWTFGRKGTLSEDEKKEARMARREQVANIVDALDQDKPISSAFAPEVSSLERLEVVSETLLIFLRGLTDGVITTPLWNRIEQAGLPSISSQSNPLNDINEDDKSAILDILQTAPNHNICFVFLTTTLAKIISELSPLSKAEIDILKNQGQAPGRLSMLGRKSLSFRRSGADALIVEAMSSLEKRKSREKRVAEVFGDVVCRVTLVDKDKDRKGTEDRRRAVVELFLRRRGDG